MRTSTKTWACSLPLVLAVAAGLGGCIKRQPLPEPTPGEVTATTPDKPVATRKSAPTEATGKWGQVQGTDLLEGRGTAAFSLGGQEDKVSLSQQEVSGEEFAQALRMDTQRPSGKPWDVQIRTQIAKGVEQGDILLATFFIRAGSLPGQAPSAETEFVFELGAAPYTKSVTHGLTVGPDWQKVYVPFKAEANYAPGSAQAAFRLGYKPQRIELGSIKIENFGKELALADLPTSSVTYRGMAQNAPWRAAAAERISRLRQGDLEVVVQDKSGKPIAGATVEVAMVRHAFQFGTSAPAVRILEADSKFRQVLEENFNLVSLDPDLEWPALSGEWGGTYTLERAQTAIDALKLRGVAVRGSALVSPGWQGVPSSLSELAGKPSVLGVQVRTHVEGVVSGLKGRVSQWDVIAEPYDHHEVLDVLGTGAAADWFKWARAADPDAKLLLGENGLLVGKGMAPRRAAFDDLVKKLEAAGAPVDGLALQAVFGPSLTPPEVLLETLDRLTVATKKPILVTAFDVAGVSEELRARYLADFYTAMFSHPSVQGVVLLGFWDGAHVRNDSMLFSADWSEKAGAAAFRKLVNEAWRTKATGQVDATGTYKQRAFQGDYLVRAKGPTGEAEARGSVGPGGGRIVVQL